MNFEEYRTMVPLYVAGRLTGTDLEAFEAELRRDSRLRIEAEELREIWDGLDDLDEEQPSVAMRAGFYRKLSEAAKGPSTAPGWFARWWSFPSLRYGAALLFAAGLAAGIWLAPLRSSNPETARLRAEVQRMRTLMALSMLSRESAAGRLEGISLTTRMRQPDPEISAALVSTVNDDPDINVRLSAVDALQSFASAPGIRNALAESISRQQSPLVQIALIDALVDSHGREALSVVSDIARNREYDENVRQRAQWALARFETQ